MTNFLVLDTETSGVPGNRKNGSDYKEDFSSIDVTQIGLIKANDNFEELEAHDLRCKISEDVTPSPEAYLTHGDFDNLYEGNSALQMFSEFDRILDEMPLDSHLLSYNGATFDLPVLWANLYKNLIFPYKIQRLAPTHIDVQNLVLLATSLYSNFPRKYNCNKNITRKLTTIAEMLGVANFNAHDAVADCKMTLEIFKILSNDFPNVFQSSFVNGNKEKLYKNLQSGLILCEFDDFIYNDKKGPISKQPLIAIARDGNYALCLDLTIDPDEFFNLDDEQLCQEIGFSSSSPIRSVKINKSLAFGELDHFDLDKEFSIPDTLIAKRINEIKENYKFQGHASRVWKSKKKKKFICLDRPEAQLYSSDYFPDESTMKRFHEAPDISSKKKILLSADQRLQYLGRCLLCKNNSEELNAADSNFISEHIRDRLSNNFNYSKEYPKGLSNAEALLHTRIYMKGAQFNGQPITPDKIKGLRKLEDFYQRRQNFIDGGSDG